MKLFNLIQSIKKFFFPPHPSISPHLFTSSYLAGEWLGFSGDSILSPSFSKMRKGICATRHGNGEICTVFIATDYLCPINRISGVDIKPYLLIVHCRDMNCHFEIPHTKQTYHELKEILKKYAISKSSLNLLDKTQNMWYT